MPYVTKVTPNIEHRSDFGGMDVYTTQLLGPGHPHDTFYTNPTVIASILSHAFYNRI